jgi:hypothetical protein
MKIYTPEAPIPAAVVTLASGKDQRQCAQPIIFSTLPGAAPYSNTAPWMIKSVDVTLLRDWNCGQFSLLLAIPMGEKLGAVPKMPDVSQWRGPKNSKDGYVYLSPEDEIRIYMGYVPPGTAEITYDMLDSVPFTVMAHDTYTGDQVGKTQSPAINSSPDKPLAPVFWGFIDRIDYMMDEKGIQCFIQGRDRVRALMDTKILNIDAFTGTGDIAEAGGSKTGRREQILLDVANAAVGSVLTGEITLNDLKNTPSCWRYIVRGYEFLGYPYDSSTDKAKNSNKYQKTNINDSSDSAAQTSVSRNLIPIEGPALWSLTASMSQIPDTASVTEASSIKFHRWVQRPPIQKGAGNVYEVFNKIPLEIIHYLSNTEDSVTDFYCSHVNGEFVFAPSFLDTSGLQDEERNYRTYYFLTSPTGNSPSAAQMIKKLRASTTSLGMYNRFAVLASGNSQATGSTVNDLKAILDASPNLLKGRDLNPPCRTVVIPEDNLDQVQSVTANAMSMALSHAEVMARDASGVAFTIMGDPTFFPGEAVIIYNTGLHDDGVEVADISKTTLGIDYSKSVIDFTQTINSFLPQGTAQGNGDNNITNPFLVSTLSNKSGKRKLDTTNPYNKAITWAQDALTSPNMKDASGKSTGVAGPLAVDRSTTNSSCPPVYKIRSIRHVLTTAGSDAGFTTSLLGTTGL